MISDNLRGADNQQESLEEMKEIVEEVLRKHYGLQKAKKDFYEPLKQDPDEVTKTVAEWSRVGVDLIARITDDIERMTGHQFRIGREHERNLLDSSETTRQSSE